MVSSPIEDIFRILHTVITYGGFSITPYNKWPLLTLFRRVFVFIVFLSILLCTLLSFHLWIFDFAITTKNVSAVIYTVIFVLSTSSFIAIMIWQIKDYFSIHKQLIINATSQAGCIYYRKKLHSYLTFLVIILIATFIALNIQYLLLVLDIVISSTNLMRPTEIYYNLPGSNVIASVTYCFMMLACEISLAVFFLVCYIDKLEFAFLNMQISNERNLDVKSLTEYFDKHTKLIIAVEHADCMFKYYLLGAFAGAIPSFVFCIYATLKILTLQENLMVGIGDFVIANLILFFTIIPASLNNEINRTSEIIYEKTKFMDLASTPEIYRLVSWFALKSANKPSGLSVGGFLIITYKLLITTATFIFSYLTFLIQSFPAENCKEPAEYFMNITEIKHAISTAPSQ